MKKTDPKEEFVKFFTNRACGKSKDFIKEFFPRKECAAKTSEEFGESSLRAG